MRMYVFLRSEKLKQNQPWGPLDSHQIIVDNIHITGVSFVDKVSGDNQIVANFAIAEGDIPPMSKYTRPEGSCPEHTRVEPTS